MLLLIYSAVELKHKEKLYLTSIARPKALFVSLRLTREAVIKLYVIGKSKVSKTQESKATEEVIYEVKKHMKNEPIPSVSGGILSTKYTKWPLTMMAQQPK